MSNEEERKRKEMESLFKDPKFCRQAWKSVGLAIAQNPANKPTPFLDKEGNETYNSLVERYSYDKLADDIKNVLKIDREPTELEMIMQCQMIKARTDTSAAIFVRDTLGAKPVDESKVDASLHNPYEDMSDEELAVLAEYREKKRLEADQHLSLDQAKVERVEEPLTQHIVEE